MAVTIKQRSRLQFGQLKSIDGFEFWDLLQLPVLLPQADDVFYTVTGPDRIDLLAYRFYGDPILWWVIAVANNLELLPTDMSPGDVLRIPSVRYVTYIYQKYANVSAGTLNPATQTSTGGGS